MKGKHVLGFLMRVSMDGVQQYWSGSPDKTQSFQGTIKCWAIIGPPAERHMWLVAG